MFSSCNKLQSVVPDYLPQYEIVKTVIVGDQRVGKSTLVSQLINPGNTDKVLTTVGLDYTSKMLSINKSSVKIWIWDTSGDPAYSSFVTDYSSKSDLVLVVFDVGNIQTFVDVRYIIYKIRESCCGREQVIVIVGTKTDLRRTVSYAMAKQIADELDCEYVELCCLSDVQVLALFQDAVSKVISKRYKASATVSSTSSCLIV